jgi:hypothetical protein
VVSFTPQPLYPLGKSTRCVLDRRLGGHQSRSGRCGERNLALPGIEPGASSSSPSLYRRSYQVHGSNLGRVSRESLLRFSVVFLSYSRQTRKQSLDQVITVSYQIFSNSPFISHLTIRRYVVQLLTAGGQKQEFGCHRFWH